MRIRIIPCLLLQQGGLVKSVRFKNHQYVGDPINAVKIFNDKEADEIAIIDISASAQNKVPDYSLISEIVSEAFMPVAFGGGINSMEVIKEIFYRGVEKVIINRAAHKDPNLINDAANLYGSQSIVVSIDVKKTLFKGHRVYIDNGRTETGLNPVDFAKHVEKLGAGEILLNSIDRDGTYSGYDADLISDVSHSVNIPVIALGGAGSVEDFVIAKQYGASAVSAGSMFVFKRPHQAVLINYPSQDELSNKLFNRV